MKRLLTGALALLLSIAAHATTLNPVQLLNPTGSTSGQAIVSTGASSAPGWANVAATSLAAQAANTVVANVTGSSASPTAFAMPSCSTSASALDWTSGTGFTCNTAVNAAQLGGATFASPGPIGSTTASTGAFTTLSASSTVSGTGFSTYLASPPAIGGTAAAAGSFTTLSASGTVSGTGFTNLFASPPAIGGTAAAAGKFTTLQATSTITPSTTAGIVGTATNDNANAGSVGETITATASGVAQTSGTLTNVTSVSLTAGDWDVTCSWASTAATSITSLNFGLTTTSGAQAPVGQRVLMGGLASASGIELVCPTFRLSLASSATLYLTSAPGFTGSLTVGGTIWARRRR